MISIFLRFNSTGVNQKTLFAVLPIKTKTIIMKKILLILFLAFLASGTKAQNCAFTYAQQGALTAVQFTPTTIFPLNMFTYAWDFGDGGTSTQTSPSHTYNGFGPYTVCCVVSDTSGTAVCNFCTTVYLNSSTCSFTYTSSPAQNFVVTFQASQSQASSYFWDYGDGMTGTGGPSNTHAYVQSGTYNACLTTIDFLGDTCTYCTWVTVSQQTNNCFFTASPDTALVVSFIGLPSNGGSALTWDFGDGSVVTGMNPYHQYALPGTYTVCMTELNSSGVAICTYCDVVTAANNIMCSYSFVIDTTNAYSVAFTAHPSGQSSVISWDFGDGNTATGYNPTHVYSVVGTYTACMTETDFFGTVLCQYCVPITITGSGSGNCSFISSPDPMNQGMINFQAFQGTSGTSVLWDFGDNTTGSGINPSHTYVIAGTYTVCMSEVSPAGSIICSYCDVVTVGNAANCTFAFVVDTVIANQVLFSFVPNSSASQILWDFGDGSAGMGANAQHVYPVPGVYTACVTEINTTTGVTICYTCQVIAVNFIQSCSFTAVPDPNDPYTLTLTGTVGPGNIASWDFGDGNVGTGTQIQHTFTQAGLYHICLYEVDSLPLTTICVSCQDIFVGSIIQPCRANFIATNLGLTGYFIDMSTGISPQTTYAWDFGDGTTSTTRFPQHVYSAPGTYTACLTITDNSCSDTYCSTVVADTSIGNPGACQAYFVTLQLAPYQIAVVNLTNGVNLSFAWDFGDGSTSNQPYPSHVYNSIGSYNLCLTVSDLNGCTSTYCDSVSVDSLGNIFRGMSGFTVNVLSPAQLTGVEDSPESTPFIAYPNPVQSELTIALPSTVTGTVSYRVFTVQGAEVSKGILSNGFAKLSVLKWEAGIYLLEITDDAGYKSYRQIIKQ